MEPVFYVSYSRDDYETRLSKFVQDLDYQVKLRLGYARQEIVSFFDQLRIAPGESWNQAVFDALRKSGVLVALCTPRYFRRTLCGKEVQVFLERQRLAPEVRRQHIIPVIWVPDPDGVRTPLDDIQIANDFLPREYFTQGLRFLAMRRNRSYQRIVQGLADWAVDTSRSSLLPALPASISFDEIGNAFDAVAVSVSEAAPAFTGAPPHREQPPGTAGRYFICYRREESSCYAGWLKERMCTRFGAEHVFMDLDSIEPGEDFERAIEQALADCKGLVVLIGRKWLTLKGANRKSRLLDENDYVRREIAVALAEGVRVVPILLDNARMPSADQLPDDLQLLAKRNAIKTEASRFIEDTDRLMNGLGKGA